MISLLSAKSYFILSYHSSSYLISHEAAGVICAREPVTLDPGCGEADSLCLAGGHTPASGNVYLGGR